MKGEFYKMEFDAWDEGTVDLSLEEEAAYLRLCHQMYRRRGPVPNSDRLLVSLWRCHQNKARPLLQRLIAAGKIFVTPEGHLSNTRVTQEVDARETLSTHRADAGHTGGIRSGHARRKSLKTNDVDEAKRSREEKIREEENREDKTHSVSDVGEQVIESFGSSPNSPVSPQADTLPFDDLGQNQTVLPRARGTALVPASRRSTAVDGHVVEAFEVWWSAYPLKKSKEGARKKHAEIIKAGRATEGELLEGALRYAAERAGQEVRFTKHPTTWLNQGCWSDEPSKPPDSNGFGSLSPMTQRFLQNTSYLKDQQ